MAYVLTFLGGAMCGGIISTVMMCCFIVSGRESREEEKYLNGKQNQSDGI